MTTDPAREILDALHETDERYRFLTETIPVQVWTALPDGNLDYVTEQTAKRLGLTQQQLLEDGWQNVVHPDDLPLAIERWTRSITTGDPYEVEFRLKLHTGVYSWHLVRAIAQRDSAHDIVRWFGSNTDIQEQRDQQRHTQALLDEVARQSDQLRVQNRSLALQADIGIALTRSTSLKDALTASAEIIVRHLDAAFARIWTLNEATSVLELQASAGMYTHIDGAHGRVPVGHFKIGKIAAERRPHSTNSVVGDPLVADQAWALREGMVAFAGYPLLVGDALVGVVALFARQPLAEFALRALEGVINGLALVIEKRRIDEERLRLLAQERIARHDADSARAELQSLFMQAPAPICMLRGPAHTFTLANPAYLQLVGSGRQILGMPVREALPELEGQGFFELLDHVYATGERFIGSEMPAKFDRRGDGASDDAFVNLVYDAFYDVDGRVAGILVIAFDVTDTVRARHAVQATLDDRERLLRIAEESRERAELASRAKDEFLATASHELRTPLNAILGWARILRTGSVNDANYARGLETIERNGRAQVQLIEDILDGSRIITGKLHLEIRSLDLSKIVEASLDAVRPAALARSITIKATLEPGNARILGDPDRLQQVVWNLVNNAIKFTPRGGKVEVHVARSEASIALSVKDDGQGISSEFLPCVFERFRQADATTTRKHGGLGLGLALVRHLVEAHGGTVSAASEGEGRGATFTAILPVQAVNLTEAQSERPSAPQEMTGGSVSPLSLANVTVLILDDMPDARDLLATTLRAHGADVMVASSVDQAVEMLVQRTPAVIVSDIGMPGEDGYSLIARVRGRGPPVSRVPAIALTAYAREEDRRRSLEAGFQAHVAKPVDPLQLVQMVRDLAYPAGKR